MSSSGSTLKARVSAFRWFAMPAEKLAPIKGPMQTMWPLFTRMFSSTSAKFVSSSTNHWGWQRDMSLLEVKPYQCNTCGETFRVNPTARNHCKKEHGQGSTVAFVKSAEIKSMNKENVIRIEPEQNARQKYKRSKPKYSTKKDLPM